MTVNGQPLILPDRAQALAVAHKFAPFRYAPHATCDPQVTVRADGTFDLDIRAQTRAVIQNIEAILKAANATLANVIDMTVFLVDMKDYAAFNEVYNEFFAAATGPSRTTVGVRELPSPKLLIEIKATALMPSAQ